MWALHLKYPSTEMTSYHFYWWLFYSLLSSYSSCPLSDHPVKPYFHIAAAVFSSQFFTLVLRQGFILWARVLYIIQAGLEFRILVPWLPEITVLGLQDCITPSDELCFQPTAWFFLSCKNSPSCWTGHHDYAGLSGLALLGLIWPSTSLELSH